MLVYAKFGAFLNMSSSSESESSLSSNFCFFLGFYAEELVAGLLPSKEASSYYLVILASSDFKL